MRVNHLIIGTENLDVSAQFYIFLFGFIDSGSFIDTGTQKEGKVLTSHSANDHPFQLLLVPFIEERHPGPQHLAFEVNDTEFDLIYERAKKNGIKTRMKSPLECEEEAVGYLESNGNQYQNFYISDPTNINIEIMTKCK